jgi:hypothetical protein
LIKLLSLSVVSSLLLSPAAFAQNSGDAHFDTIMDYVTCSGQHAKAVWQGDGWMHYPLPGATFPAHYDDHMQYKTDDGRCFKASWQNGKFYHEPFPGNGHTPAHYENYIIYITDNGDHFMAYRAHDGQGQDGFLHVYLGPPPAPPSHDLIQQVVNFLVAHKQEIEQGGVVVMDLVAAAP